jgi:hypothetical protein
MDEVNSELFFNNPNARERVAVAVNLSRYVITLR